MLHASNSCLCKQFSCRTNAQDRPWFYQAETAYRLNNRFQLNNVDNTAWLLSYKEFSSEIAAISYQRNLLIDKLQFFQ